MIEALNTKVTIKRIHKETTTSGGIVLQNEDNPNPQGIVQSVGPDVKGIGVEDVVFIDWRYTFQLTFDKEDNTYVTDASNVLAVERK